MIRMRHVHKKYYHQDNIYNYCLFQIFCLIVTCFPKKSKKKLSLSSWEYYISIMISAGRLTSNDLNLIAIQSRTVSGITHMIAAHFRPSINNKEWCHTITYNMVLPVMVTSCFGMLLVFLCSMCFYWLILRFLSILYSWMRNVKRFC